jgi:hypothetical protein
VLAEAAEEGNPDIGGLLVEVASRLGPSNTDEIGQLGADFVDDWVFEADRRHPDALGRFNDAGVGRAPVVALFSNSFNTGFENLKSPEGQRLVRTLEGWQRPDR